MQSYYDIVVAGAGVAGFAAAVEAGRCGKRVLIVEKNGMPGGCLTVGGNNDIAQFWAHKKQIIKGIGWEYCRRLEALGGARIPDMMTEGKPHWFYGVHVNIPLASSLMDEMLLEAGVDICYEETICAANTVEDTDGRRKIQSVTITSKSGLIEVEADTFIDCTGDGDLAVFAGADFECGTPDELGLSLQPGTIRYFIGGAKLSDEEEARVNAVLKECVADGSLKAPDIKGSTYGRLLRSKGNNTNHISRFNGADSSEKTAANIEGRRCVTRIYSALRRAGITPDIEMVCPETAVRETRRIVCEGYITAGDYVAARKYPDGVCHSFYPIDLHRDGMGGIQQVFLEEGKAPSIPLSAMVAKGLTNLYVAGRCASGDRLANSAYRVKASCMAMGQAAGAAASLSPDGRKVDIHALRALLVNHDCIVPELAD